MQAWLYLLASYSDTMTALFLLLGAPGIKQHKVSMHGLRRGGLLKSGYQRPRIALPSANAS